MKGVLPSALTARDAGRKLVVPVHNGAEAALVNGVDARARAGKPNADLAGGEIDRFCRPDGRGMALLEAAMERLGLSARADHRILKLARTTADLDHAEAVGYRQLDRRSRF